VQLFLGNDGSPCHDFAFGKSCTAGMKTAKKLQRLGLLLVLSLLCSQSRADLVYDNSSNDLNTRFNAGTNEVGDEIVLTTTNSSRYVTNFIFEYYGVNFSGNEQARLRFYRNDGTNSTSGQPVPNTVIYDSGYFPVGPTDRSTLNFTRENSRMNVLVPDSFTWSVQFAGIESGEESGVGADIYSPPTVGQNYSDYWDFSASGWQLRTNNAVPVSFGARVHASPRPLLDIERSGNNVIVSWPGPSILQSSINVAGVYVDVSGATSPYTNNPPLSVQRYFRLRN
jgi:hypothetical protein